MMPKIIVVNSYGCGMWRRATVLVTTNTATGTKRVGLTNQLSSMPTHANQRTSGTATPFSLVVHGIRNRRLTGATSRLWRSSSYACRHSSQRSVPFRAHIETPVTNRLVNLPLGEKQDPLSLQSYNDPFHISPGCAPCILCWTNLPISVLVCLICRHP